MTTQVGEVRQVLVDRIFGGSDARGTGSIAPSARSRSFVTWSSGDDLEPLDQCGLRRIAGGDRDAPHPATPVRPPPSPALQGPA